MTHLREVRLCIVGTVVNNSYKICHTCDRLLMDAVVEGVTHSPEKEVCERLGISSTTVALYHHWKLLDLVLPAWPLKTCHRPKFC